MNSTTPDSKHSQPADLDPRILQASKVIVTLATELKDVPTLAELQAGGISQVMTDHMILATYDPVQGWSAPEIRPYGPLSLMPSSSCFQYATNLFEGMKAYAGPDGEPRLFRPEKNMARLARSAARLALPTVNTAELLKLIKQMVMIDKRWVPAARGYSLYLRPMIVGTRNSINLKISDSAMLWVMAAPIGPYVRVGRPLSLFAATDTVRAWPGGTGEHKIATNYGPTLRPHSEAQAAGFDMNLWLLGDKITEAGVMNIFVVLKGDDRDYDLVTPPLDGTILPGITRESVMQLAAAHPDTAALPHISETTRLHVIERTLTMPELESWLAQDRVVEVFAVGTAVVVVLVGRIRWNDKDIVLPTFGEGLGPVSAALRERLTDIQDGRYQWEDWSVPYL